LFWLFSLQPCNEAALACRVKAVRIRFTYTRRLPPSRTTTQNDQAHFPLLTHGTTKGWRGPAASLQPSPANAGYGTFFLGDPGRVFPLPRETASPRWPVSAAACSRTPTSFHACVHAPTPCRFKVFANCPEAAQPPPAESSLHPLQAAAVCTLATNPSGFCEFSPCEGFAGLVSRFHRFSDHTQGSNGPCSYTVTS
jgi:hypothetical protein